MQRKVIVVSLLEGKGDVRAGGNFFGLDNNMELMEMLCVILVIKINGYYYNI